MSKTQEQREILDYAKANRPRGALASYVRAALLLSAVYYAVFRAILQCIFWYWECHEPTDRFLTFLRVIEFPISLQDNTYPMISQEVKWGFNSLLWGFVGAGIASGLRRLLRRRTRPIPFSLEYTSPEHKRKRAYGLIVVWVSATHFVAFRILFGILEAALRHAEPDEWCLWLLLPLRVLYYPSHFDLQSYPGPESDQMYGLDISILWGVSLASLICGLRWVLGRRKASA